jgi:hypothetical protein
MKSAALVVFTLGLFINPLRAAEQIVVMEIPNISERDNSGLYDQVLTRVLDKSELNVSVEYLPMNRAIKEFERGNYSCVYPIGFQGVTDVGTSSVLVNYFSYQFFSLQFSGMAIEQIVSGDYAVAALDFEETRRLADEMGLDVDIFVSSNRNLAKMLRMGRVDFVFSISPDFPLEFEDQHAAVNLIRNGDAFERTPDGFICADDQTGEQILQSFNEALTEMTSGGELRSILGPLYVER